MATANERLQEVNERIRKGNASNDASHLLPADYSSLIKAAMAERGQAAQMQQQAPQQQVAQPPVVNGDPWSGMRNAGQQGVSANVGNGTSAASQGGQTASLPQNGPMPSARPTQEQAPTPGEDATADTGGGSSDLLKIAVGVLGVAGAALYLRKKLKGEPTLQEDEAIKNAAGGEAGKTSRVTGTGNDVAMSPRMGEIVDGEFEELPPRGQQQIAGPNQSMITGEQQIGDYIDELEGRPAQAAISAVPNEQINLPNQDSGRPPIEMQNPAMVDDFEQRMGNADGFNNREAASIDEMIEQLLLQSDEIKGKPRGRVRAGKAGTPPSKPRVRVKAKTGL